MFVVEQTAAALHCRVETLLGEEVVSTDDLIDNDNLHVFTERRAAADRRPAPPRRR